MFLAENVKQILIIFLMVTGGIAIFISLLNSPALWLMLIFAILFVGLKGVEITGVDFTKTHFGAKTNDHFETEEPKAVSSS